MHTPEYIETIASTAGRASLMLDPDTFTVARVLRLSRCLAAGACARSGRPRHGAASSTMRFAAVRPPGHHAERERAMGFCLFNNVAVAAAHALEAPGSSAS